MQKKTISIALITLSLLTLGGFYDWAVMLNGVFVCVGIILFYTKNSHVKKLPGNMFFYGPFIFGIAALLSLITAVDRAADFIGLMYVATALLWYYLCYQNGNETNAGILKTVPYLGAFITCIGLVSLPFPTIYNFFWTADRYGGVFLYPNACALFMVIGIIILTHDIKWKKFSIDYVLLALLVVGLLLSASRSVELLFVVWCIYVACKNKNLRKPVLIGLGVLSCGVVLVGFLTGMSSNVSRILKLFSESSTIWGRLLYDADGLKILAGHPLGLGYLGYYFIQGSCQNGVYVVRFAHNDFLQAGLDYGIIAMLAMTAFVIYQIFKGKTDETRREVLAFIALASLMDFHLQFMPILMVGMLCLDYEYSPAPAKQKLPRENYVFLGIFILVFGYFVIPCLCNFAGNTDMALKWWGSYTQAQIDKLCEDIGQDEAEYYGAALIGHNEYATTAYNVLSYSAALSGDYDRAMELRDKVISLQRYNIDMYIAYDELLIDMMEAAGQDGDETAYAKLSAKYDELPEKLSMLEETTSPLAYKIKDLPRFSYR